jgi:hypothetical protein
MALRDFILNNLRWKLIALTLATVVWFIIQFAIWKGIKPTDHPLSDFTTYNFSRQPVLVLRAPGDPAVYKVAPARVEVMIRSTAGVLNKFSEDDIKIFVDVAEMRDTGKETKQVFIYAPENSQITETKVEPSTVTVERIAPPK